MTTASKTVLMNVIVLAVGVFFYLIGRPARGLVISVAICLLVLNVVMLRWKPRG